MVFTFLKKMLFEETTVLLKAVFLVNNVALLEQQARVCEATTGLPTKRFLMYIYIVVVNIFVKAFVELMVLMTGRRVSGLQS